MYMYIYIHIYIIYRHGVDHVPVVMGIGRTAFLANISIGSPRQSFTVLLDTVAS